jgi:hypothetical protein
MQPVNHPIKHQYQPTNSSCSPTALAILLSSYDRLFSPHEVMEKVPQVKDENDKDAGTINQQLATWSISLGFDVTMYTFDCQIIDQPWAKLSKSELLQRLEARKNGWEVPALGSLWTTAYVQSYIDFLNAGGDLHIQPSVTSKLLYTLLETGPLLPCLCDSTLYGEGRSRHETDTDSIKDDVNGKTFNHSVVIYGNDAEGKFLVADPWHKPGLHVVEPERMIAAISTAQIECDNLIFQLNKK